MVPVLVRTGTVRFSLGRPRKARKEKSSSVSSVAYLHDLHRNSRVFLSAGRTAFCKKNNVTVGAVCCRPNRVKEGGFLLSRAFLYAKIVDSRTFRCLFAAFSIGKVSF